MKRIFKFNREVDDFDVWRWYVELPEWEGSKADLEMVAGADGMLECLRGKDETSVEVVVSEKVFRSPDLYLFKVDDLGNYYADDLSGKFFPETLHIWLCEVTLFVFGYYPTYLYLKVL